MTRASKDGEPKRALTQGEQTALVLQAFEEHAQRAALLAGERSPVRAPLLFAVTLYRAQAAVAVRLLHAHAERPLTGLLAEDVARVVESLGPLWDAAATGPQPLAEAARERAGESAEVGGSRLLTTFSEGGGEDWLSRAALRPWLSALAVVGVQPRHVEEAAATVANAVGIEPVPHSGAATNGTASAPAKRGLPILDAGSVGGVVLAAHGKYVTEGGRCPFCAGKPWVASRRILPETDGATRFLHCALCGSEWRVNRIRCPWCGEEDPAKLPQYEAAEAQGARLEGCETCGRYLKSIDRSTDMRRVPEVDDVATLGLDLWAEEQGMVRGEAGLLGG